MLQRPLRADISRPGPPLRYTRFKVFGASAWDSLAPDYARPTSSAGSKLPAWLRVNAGRCVRTVSCVTSSTPFFCPKKSGSNKAAPYRAEFAQAFDMHTLPHNCMRVDMEHKHVDIDIDTNIHNVHVDIYIYTHTCIHVNTCKYVYVCICKHVCLYMYIHIRVYIHTYTHIHTCMHACMHTYIHRYVSVCGCVCVYVQIVRMYVCTYVCMYADNRYVRYVRRKACEHMNEGRICVCMYAYMYVCMYACMHACMHVSKQLCMYFYRMLKQMEMWIQMLM